MVDVFRVWLRERGSFLVPQHESSPQNNQEAVLFGFLWRLHYIIMID